MENGPHYILQLWFISTWKIPLHCKLYTATCSDNIGFGITILIADLLGISWLLDNKLYTSSKGLFSFFHTFGKNIHVKSYRCFPIYSINDDWDMKSFATLKFWLTHIVYGRRCMPSHVLSPLSCSPLIVSSPLLLSSPPSCLYSSLFLVSTLFLSLPLFPLQLLVLNLAPLLLPSTLYFLPPHLSNFKACSRIAPTEAHRLKGRGL